MRLTRAPGQSLGISIMGGRGMGRRLSSGEMMRGVFIKNISPDSPAASNGTLRAGDRILKVCECLELTCVLVCSREGGAVIRNCRKEVRVCVCVFGYPVVLVCGRERMYCAYFMSMHLYNTYCVCGTGIQYCLWSLLY